ncbi:aspartate kinase [Paenimyroides ummariense]|uniref:Aspartate kinase n=1 Tax=Paenimyroides ummariense TaxID=913024 RepID=A0A1I4YTV3_9FLAO|nr:bifunctional aspartate kinase/homoserine dehydrogenase I [Paenimyroides ummariense]SFN41060.1 aspartate kinase [Paenimyroides ummariense]
MSKVLKFGGKSLASLHTNNNLLNIIANYLETSTLIIVVSAIGNTTDLLLELLEKAKENKPYTDQLQELNALNFYPQINTEEHFKLIENILQGVSLIQDYSAKVQDLLLAQGELISSKVVTQLLLNQGLQATFVNSSQLIKTDAYFTAANVNETLTELAVKTEFEKLSDKKLIVLGGFIGSTAENEITTLGRNGSNLTAALIANYTQAEEFLNFTHVDGIYTANPEWVASAKRIEHLNYSEANELATFGASILHAKTIVPLIDKKIPLRILNTLNPDSTGTLISAEPTPNGVKSLTVLQNVALINFHGKGLFGKVGVDARIFNALAKNNISVSVISQGSSERGLGFVVNDSEATSAKEILEHEFQHDFYTKDVENISINNNIAVVSIIGQDLKSFHKPYSALVKNGIVPILFNNSVSGKNISLVIEKEQFKKALHVIHGQIFGVNKTVNIAVVGKGTVGSVLIDQIVASKNQISERKNIDLNIFAIANSHSVYFSTNGFNTNWQDQFNIPQPNSLSSIIEYAKENHLENLILIDNTAAESLPNRYNDFIDNGFDIVSSNKIANTLSFEFYKNLRENLKKNQKQYLYETNVGAGLPLIDNIKLLHLSGENITKIKGVFSGTLSYIFNLFSVENKPFSEVLRAAIEKGFTEPDPRDDLSGTDVARKLLILARELDLENELQDISIQNLIPTEFQSLTVQEFLAQLSGLNNHYDDLKQQLKANEVLRYVGELSGDLQQQKGVLETKLVKVDKNSALGQLSGSDSIFEIYTESYGDRPIIIQGAGAGAHVTARGVFGDILRLAEKK